MLLQSRRRLSLVALGYGLRPFIQLWWSCAGSATHMHPPARQFVRAFFATNRQLLFRRPGRGHDLDASTVQDTRRKCNHSIIRCGYDGIGWISRSCDRLSHCRTGSSENSVIGCSLFLPRRQLVQPLTCPDESPFPSTDSLIVAPRSLATDASASLDRCAALAPWTVWLLPWPALDPWPRRVRSGAPTAPARRKRPTV